MKQALAALLIALLASMMVSAKVHHRKRDHDDRVERPHHHGDSDDYDDYRCYMDLIECAENVTKYQTGNSLGEVGQSIEDAGIAEVCNDMTEVTECGLGVLLSDKCDSLPDEMKDIAKKVIGFINFVCITKIDEIQENKKCLFSAEVDMSLDVCNNYETDLEKCKPGKFLNCLEAAMEKNDDCTEEAFNLLTELINEAIAIVPTEACQGGDESFGSENSDDDDDDNVKVINYSRRIARYLKKQLLKRK